MVLARRKDWGPASLLLLATRQRRGTGGLTDPLGNLIDSARTAGFRYLQRIVVVHGYPAIEIPRLG